MTGINSTIGSTPYSQIVLEGREQVRAKIREANLAVFEAVRIACNDPLAQSLFSASQEDLEELAYANRSSLKNCLDTGVPIFRVRITVPEVQTRFRASSDLSRSIAAGISDDETLWPDLATSLNHRLKAKIVEANLAVYETVRVGWNDPLAPHLFECERDSLKAIGEMRKSSLLPVLQSGTPAFALRLTGEAAGSMYRDGSSDALFSALMTSFGKFIPACTL